MTNHSIPIHHSQKDGRSRPFFSRKDAYHLCTAFVLPIIPPSLSLSYHFRHPHIVPPSLCSLLSTFYHSNTSNISQLSHISRFSHISQKIHPSYPSQMFPTHSSHPPHLPPRLYIAGRRHSLSLNSQNSQNSHLKILRKAHSSPVAHHPPVSPMLRLPSQPSPP